MSKQIPMMTVGESGDGLWETTCAALKEQADFANLLYSIENPIDESEFRSFSQNLSMQHVMQPQPQHQMMQPPPQQQQIQPQPHLRLMMQPQRQHVMQPPPQLMQPQQTVVYHPPLSPPRLPAQRPVFYALQSSMNSTGGGYYQPPQMPPAVVHKPVPQHMPPAVVQKPMPIQNPVPSQSVQTNNGKRKAEQPAAAGTSKRVRMSGKTYEMINVLRELIPYHPTPDAAATLANVIDYIKTLKEQLEIQSSGTTAGQDQDQDMPDSPIHGVVERPHQMRGTGHVVPPTTMSFPINQATHNAAAVGVVVSRANPATSRFPVHQSRSPVNQGGAAVSATVINQGAAVINRGAAVSAAAINQGATVINRGAAAVSPTVGRPEMGQANFSSPAMNSPFFNPTI